MRIVQTRLLFWAHGMTVSPGLILIRPEYASDRPLIAHETVHAAQMTKHGTWRFWWHYITDSKFRLEMELEAYRVQLAMAPQSLERVATALSSRYFLNITNAQAVSLLRRNCMNRCAKSIN